MKKDSYKSRSCKETVTTSRIGKPEIGRYIEIDGKWTFRASSNNKQNDKY